jgi:hypothetical protein
MDLTLHYHPALFVFGSFYEHLKQGDKIVTHILLVIFLAVLKMNGRIPDMA